MQVHPKTPEEFPLKNKGNSYRVLSSSLSLPPPDKSGGYVQGTLTALCFVRKYIFHLLLFLLLATKCDIRFQSQFSCDALFAF